MSKLNYIDNSEEAKKTYKKHFLKNNSTIFLNGKWGSGKTTYLKEVFKDSDESIDVRYIDMWHQNDIDPIQTFYRELYKYSFYFIKGIVIIFTLILLTLSFAIGHIQSYERISISLLTLGLILSLNTFILNINWEDFFFAILKVRSKISKKKKIVIIDDFDRISSDTQEILYKIFDSLDSNDIQFVFVGYYLKIAKSNTTYLQKIMDYRIELPYKIQSVTIWKKYYDLLVEEIKDIRKLPLAGIEINGIETLFSLAINENRVIRELKKFSALVESIIIDEDRIDKVNLNQQLIILYLYEFHYSLYEILVSEVESLIEYRETLAWSANINKKRNSKTKTEKLNQKIIDTFQLSDNEKIGILIQSLFLNDDYSLSTFSENFPNYLINYVPNNLGSNKIVKLIENEEFKEISKMNEDNIKDFYKFLLKNQGSYSDLIEKNIYNLAIFLLEENMNIEYFFKNKEKSYWKNIVSLGLSTRIKKHLPREEIMELIFDKSESLKKLDLSQKIKISMYSYHIPLEEIMKNKQELIEEGIRSITKINYAHPSVLIAADFVSLNKRETDFRIEDVQEYIQEISEDEFLYSLYYNSIISSADSKIKMKVYNEELYNILNNRLEKIDQEKLNQEFILIKK